MERKGSLLSRFLLCSQFRLWPLGRWLASCNLFSLHHSRKLQPCLTFSVISVLLLKKIPLHLENRIVWTCQWTCLFLVMVLPLGRKHCYFLDVIWWGWGEKVAIRSWRPTETTVTLPPLRSGWEGGPWEAAAAGRCSSWVNRPDQNWSPLKRMLKETTVGKNWNVSIITVPECPPILWIMAVSYHSPELIEINISVYAVEYFLRF